jgi:uncharacterized protein YjbJ (UPF0337 family)
MNRQSTMSSSGDWLFRSIKQNPEGLLLVAAGAALLMRSTGSSRPKARSARSEDFTSRMSEAAERATDSMSDTMSKATDRTRDTMSNMASQAKGKASEFASSASDFASAASDKASKTARMAGDKAATMARQTTSTAQDYASRMLEEQPLVVAVAGLAAGAALAAAFPSTQMEKETFGPIGEQVGEAAQRVGEQLKDATTAAGETLKNAARERGLSQDGLKEVATEAAETFSSRMSDKPDSAGSGAQSEQPATTDPRF